MPSIRSKWVWRRRDGISVRERGAVLGRLCDIVREIVRGKRWMMNR